MLLRGLRRRCVRPITLVLLLATWGCAREASPPVGVVVESCRTGDAADVAGVEAGVLVVEWRQGAACGDAESPYHLAMVEQELAPYGPVELLLGDGQRVVVATGGWGADLRPLLSGPDLNLHLEAGRLDGEGDHEGAARLWRGLADDLARRGRSLDAAWASARSVVAAAGPGDDGEPLASLEAGAASIPDLRLRAAYWERAGESLRGQGWTALAGAAFSSAVGILEAHAPASPGLACALLGQCRADLRGCGEAPIRALEIYRRVGDDTFEVAAAQLVLGAVRYFRSDLDEAEALYLDALDIVSRVAPGSPTESSLLGALGLSARKRGDFATARSYFTRDLDLVSGYGADSPLLAYAHNNLGLLAKQMGRYDEARMWYEEARKGFTSTADVAGILTNLGNVATFQDDLTAARRYHEEALELRLAADADSTEVAASLHNVGNVARWQGDLEHSRRCLERALELKSVSFAGTLWAATTHFELGEVARIEGRLDEAAAHHERALEIRRAIAPEHPDTAASLYGVAMVELAHGRTETAERCLREAVGLGELQRRRLDVGEEQRALFNAVFRHSYHLLVRLLADSGRTAEAWDTLEQARAGALRAAVARRGAAPESVPSELWFAKSRAEAEVERLKGRLVRVDVHRDVERLRATREQLAATETRLEEIVAQVRAAAPQLGRLDAPEPMTLDQLRLRLDPGTVVLSYAIGQERSLLLVTGAAADGGPEIRAFDVPEGMGALTGRVERFNALIGRGRSVDTADPALLAQGRRLFSLLVEPALDQVAAAERVLVVPDGPLLELPFAALVLPGDEPLYLGRSYALFVNPSASVAVEIAEAPRSRSTAVVAFGDPRYPPGAPATLERQLRPLPGSRAEVEAIGSLLGSRATVLLGEEASEAGFRRHIQGAGVLHCAVHAHVDPRTPMESALYFSLPEDAPPGDGDGVLTAWEIVDSLTTDADLVVLSACRTARGRVVPGEGTIGLARAFQVAGARTLVASQWDVDDRSTAALMTSFYEHLESGASTVEALRRARLRLVAEHPDLAHPFHWASFEVRGDWR